MIDPTFMIPDTLKQRFTDWLVESLAGQAEQYGSDEAARVIRRLSSDATFRASADQALQAGIDRFIEEYREQDEDLVDAIVQDLTFWESTEVQQALKQIVQRPGTSMPDQVKVIVHHFNSVMPQRVNREHVDKAVSYLLGCIAQELWSLPGAREVREVYGLQFQKMTAEENREQTALMRQQLDVTLQFNAEMRQAFLQLTGAMEKTLLADPAVPALVASPRPYNNLPQPTYVRFVGRDAEMEWLRERLSPMDRAWQIAINGIGGVGKTALALAVADEYRRRYQELNPEERFEAIVWVSAKEEVLTAQGRERADLPEAILHTLEDVYTAISRVLEREDITRALPEDQDALVQKALQRQRTLLVMDNMESVQDDRIKSFLRRLPAPTKALITSREWIDVADVKVLTGLSPEDAEKLIKEEATVRGVTLDAIQEERLLYLTAGLPLPIKLGIARVAGGESVEAVKRWLGDAIGDLPEYCVKGQVDLVRERNPDAWTLLLVCSLFDRETGASREALGTIADLSLKDRDDALAHLWRLFLVHRIEPERFGVLPIVQRYASSELSWTSGDQIIGAWLNWLIAFVMPFSTLNTKGSFRILALGIEYPTVRTAILRCRDQRSWDAAIRLCEGAWPYPYYTALFSDLEEILAIWLEAARETGNEPSQGKVLLHLGRLTWIREQPLEALEYLGRAEVILESNGDHAELAEAWDTLSQIYEAQPNIEAAELYARKTLDLGKMLEDAPTIALGSERLAAICCHKGLFDEAETWLCMAEGYAEDSDLPRITQPILYRRARLFMLRGDYAAATPYLKKCIENDTALGGNRYLAVDKLRLAEVYAATGNPQSARQLAVEARDLFERLGMRTMLAYAEELLNDMR